MVRVKKMAEAGKYVVYMLRKTGKTQRAIAVHVGCSHSAKKLNVLKTVQQQFKISVQNFSSK